MCLIQLSQLSRKRARARRLSVSMQDTSKQHLATSLQCCVAFCMNGQQTVVHCMGSWQLALLPPSRRQAFGVLDRAADKARGTVQNSLCTARRTCHVRTMAPFSQMSIRLQNTSRTYLPSCSLGQSLLTRTWTAFDLARSSIAFSHA